MYHTIPLSAPLSGLNKLDPPYISSLGHNSACEESQAGAEKPAEEPGLKASYSVADEEAKDPYLEGGQHAHYRASVEELELALLWFFNRNGGG